MELRHFHLPHLLILDLILLYLLLLAHQVALQRSKTFRRDLGNLSASITLKQGTANLVPHVNTIILLNGLSQKQVPLLVPWVFLFVRYAFLSIFIFRNYIGYFFKLLDVVIVLWYPFFHGTFNLLDSFCCTRCEVFIDLPNGKDPVI